MLQDYWSIINRNTSSFEITVPSITVSVLTNNFPGVPMMFNMVLQPAYNISPVIGYSNLCSKNLPTIILKPYYS